MTDDKKYIDIKGREDLVEQKCRAIVPFITFLADDMKSLAKHDQKKGGQ